jgi:hypothetical protein
LEKFKEEKGREGNRRKWRGRDGRKIGGKLEREGKQHPTFRVILRCWIFTKDLILIRLD